MKVVDPQGRTWRVSRRWMPWRRRTSTDGLDAGPDTSGLGDDPISVVLGLLALVLFIPFVLVLLLVTLEILLLLLLLPFAVLGRVLLGRHWRVEVRDGWTFAWETEAGGWSQSGRMIAHLAEGLGHGLTPWQAVQPRSQRGVPPGGQPPPPL